MNSLVIGNTSQLSHYFPDDYEKISSRNIKLDEYSDKFYDRIFLCFAEQRTFLENEGEDLFLSTNLFYTLDLIKYFRNKCKKIIVYGTSELWNDCEGPININSEPQFKETPYIKSKALMVLGIKNLRFDYNTAYQNIIILHPYNFNSIYRGPDFLFGKIFDSIKNRKIVEIGDTYFYRDLIHPKYVVERSIQATEDEIIGSGRLIFVNDFIRDLYKKAGMIYEEYVIENFDLNLRNKRKINYADNKNEYRYFNLLTDSMYDLGF